MGITFPIRLVTITMDLAISGEECDCLSPNSIAKFLNRKLYTDPEFFGDFTEENIAKVEVLDT